MTLSNTAVIPDRARPSKPVASRPVRMYSRMSRWRFSGKTDGWSCREITRLSRNSASVRVTWSDERSSPAYAGTRPTCLASGMSG